jgi:tetratricopeptide (TPR) repeat protein
VPIVLFRPIANELILSATTVQQPVSTAVNMLGSAFRIDPNDDFFALDLTRLGLRYENVGDYPQALQAYQQALAASPNQVYTAYRVAVVYLLIRADDPVADRHMIDVIDQTRQTISEYRSGIYSLRDIRITDDAYVTQIDVLLLLNRAKLFGSLNLPQGAIQDLLDAERIASQNPALFRLPGADPISMTDTQISSVELYYLLAENYDELASLTGSGAAQKLADRAWYTVIGLADRSSGRELIMSIEADAAIRRHAAH